MADIEMVDAPLARAQGALLGSEIVLDEAGSAFPAGSALSDEQRARLGSVVRLLETASENFSHIDSEAYRCVAKAAALLQAECVLTAAEHQPEKRHDSLPAWKMNRVLRFIDANLDRSIRVEEMAAIAKLSCSHFSRAFRSTIGEPPSNYVARRRVERAERLILLTDRPLSQIAVDCGMADQSHMTKLFRRSYGMSPGKWRKLQDGSDRDAPVRGTQESMTVNCTSRLGRAANLAIGIASVVSAADAGSYAHDRDRPSSTRIPLGIS